MRYRDLIKTQRHNDGTRSLVESIMAPEISGVLLDWTSQVDQGVLIGGLALSYYVKPRYTEDIDILFLSDREIPTLVPGFKRTRGHAFQHNVSHVEVKIVTPEHVNKAPELFEKVRETARSSDGVKIASPSGLVALKLLRGNLQDRADIAALIKLGQVNLDGFPLAEDRLDLYRRLVEEARSDPE